MVGYYPVWLNINKHYWPSSTTVVDCQTNRWNRGSPDLAQHLLNVTFRWAWHGFAALSDVLRWFLGGGFRESFPQVLHVFTYKKCSSTVVTYEINQRWTVQLSVWDDSRCLGFVSALLIEITCCCWMIHAWFCLPLIIEPSPWYQHATRTQQLTSAITTPISSWTWGENWQPKAGQL